MTGAAEIRADFNREASWVRHCAEHLQLTLAKRRVLEVACGGGRWTQFIADVADRVVATDPCPRLLEFGRKLGLPNTEWVECDAFSLDKIKETFSGACHINFMNHVPLELLPTFIDKLHQKLEPGSLVFWATQRFRGNPGESWYEKPETGDMVSLRHHDDGRPIEVVDTFLYRRSSQRTIHRESASAGDNAERVVVVGALPGRVGVRLISARSRDS
jgi:SAM-dependent methyltransferase